MSWNRGRTGQAWALDVDPGAARRPAAGVDEPHIFRQRVEAERRVEEYDVEGTRGAAAGRAARGPAGGTPGRITGGFCWCSEESFGERLQDAAARTAGSSALEPLELRCQHLCGRECGLDEHHLPGPARQRLEAERPRAGEQVEAASVGDRMLQPIEQRLAHAIGRRPKPWRIREVHPPTAPHSADDAHGAERCGAGVVGFSRFIGLAGVVDFACLHRRIIPPGGAPPGSPPGMPRGVLC